MKNGYEIAKVPTEGKWFEVNPLSINQKLFKRKRKDKRQEATRQLILEAFAEMNNKPERYSNDFKTLIPTAYWRPETITAQKRIAYKLGDHNANWVEQALEWAQRIANGESWKSICNDPDTANCYRLVEMKNGQIGLVGGSVHHINFSPTSILDFYYFNTTIILMYTVPLVVSYEE